VPELDEEFRSEDLDPEVRAELRGMARSIADTVARRLVATGRLLDDDPETALAHAVAARRLASRISVVREAVGIAAYHAGQWQTALTELRTYHRMTGRQDHLAVVADTERALGRPERAIDLYRAADRSTLDPGDAVELLIVAAGARRDLGQDEAAVAMLQVRELGVDAPWAARLRYAYADGLLATDRRDEAREWFARAAEADEEAGTDAAERLLELDGVTIGDDEPEPDEDSYDEADEDDEEEDEADEEEDEDEADEDEADEDDDEEEPVDVDAAEVKDLDDELDTDGVHGDDGPGTPA
jgi:tetratricopeptide (TPR) repeat protein